MKTIDEVLNLIDENVEPRRPELVPLEQALGGALAEAAVADADQPPLDRSAIDGYTLARGSRAGGYDLTGEILPGDPAPPAPGEGQIMRVFTGSAVPAECSLVMLEDSDTEGARVNVRVDASETLIRRRGSSVRAGESLLKSGVRLGPGEVAVLASAGIGRPRIIPRPRVLHITTGREIIPFERTPSPGQIRDTNGPLIRALLQESGASILPRCHVDESSEALVAVAQESAEWDLLLVSGGSSVGEYDHTRKALEALGFTVLVNRVNSRPGKPLIIARRGAQWAFGLPGNPVSHLATFHVFVARVLRRLGGFSSRPFPLARLAADVPADPNARETLWPARISSAWTDTLEVYPLPWLDSGDIRALAGVSALIRVPAHTQLLAGETVFIVPCSPSHGQTDVAMTGVKIDVKEKQ